MRNPYTRRVRRGAHGDSPTYFTLHFAIEFKHPFDRAYLTFSYPYTYTDLQNYLRNLPETHPNLSDYFINQVLYLPPTQVPVGWLSIPPNIAPSPYPYSPWVTDWQSHQKTGFRFYSVHLCK